VVISDRYIDSTIAYQCGGRGLDEAQVKSACDFATGGLLPALTFLLDISVEQSRARVVGKGQAKDRLESADVEFFERVRSEFLARSQVQQCGRVWHKLDAKQSEDELSEQIFKVVHEAAHRQTSEQAREVAYGALG
jgi:dTMP kinase